MSGSVAILATLEIGPENTKMKAYISVDLEGVSGIIHSSQTQPSEPGYNRALDMMHDETNAAIKGLLEAGVSEIVVNDSHWTCAICI